MLIMQLPQHCTCKSKHHFPYTIVPAQHDRKQLHESEYNSHESEMVPTRFFLRRFMSSKRTHKFPVPTYKVGISTLNLDHELF